MQLEILIFKVVCRQTCKFEVAELSNFKKVEVFVNIVRLMLILFLFKD